MKLSEALDYVFQKAGNAAFIKGGLNGDLYYIKSAPLAVLPKGPLFVYDQDRKPFSPNSELWKRDWAILSGDPDDYA